MTSARPSPALAPVLLLVLLLGGVTGCSSQPAVCDDVDALRQSVDDLRNTSVTDDGLDAVTSRLQDLRAALRQLSDDASNEYAPEIAGVRSSASSLGSALEQAASSPSAESLSRIRTDVEALTTAVEDLGTAVADTCE